MLDNKRHKNINNQRGMALLMVMIVIITLIMTFFTYLIIQTNDAYTDFYRSNESRQELMSLLSSEIEDYYLAHSNELSMDNLPNNISENNVIDELSIPENSAAFVRIGISNLKREGIFQWRNIYAWIPATDGIDDSQFNRDGPAGNSFTPGDGVEWTFYSGRIIESQKYSQAMDQLDNISAIMQQMYSSKINIDPIRDQSANYFANCGQRPSYAKDINTLKCSGSNRTMSLKGMGATNSTGLSNNDLINPWGNPILASNEQGTININGETKDIRSEYTPYNMILTSKMPSGHIVFTYVTQPL